MPVIALSRARRPAEGSSSPELMALRQHVDQRMVGLRTDRYSWWQHWRLIAEYLIPRRYKWLITPNEGNRGSPINQRIVNNTGTIALRVQSSGLMSGLTSPGKPWFALNTGDDELDEDPDVKTWLSEVQKRMSRVFAESNFYDVIATMDQDLGWAGSAPLVVYEDFEDVIRLVNWACGEYFLANGPRLTVDTGYREFVMTVLQVAEEFGLENCSDTIRGAIETGGAGLMREVRVGHALEANTGLLPGAPGVDGMPWREIYWELGSGRNFILRIRGYHERPFVAPRWDVIGNDAYGRSPAMDALGDIRSLQVMEKRKAQAIDKHVNPPMVADIALKNEPASLLPGGVTYVTNTGVGFKPAYEVAPDFTGLAAEIGRTEQRIKDTFFNDLFLMISQLDTVRTATEIDARQEEKLIQLGPVIERFENEALDPIIMRTYSIMLRGGLLPPMPATMKGKQPRIKYTSMLAEAQRAVSTAAIERWAAFVGNIMGADPNAIDNVDVDQTIREYADLLGVDPRLVRAASKVKAIRAQKAQAAQAQAAQAQTVANVQGAQTLSQTDVGGGVNALQLMTGRGVPQ